MLTRAPAGTRHSLSLVGSVMLLMTVVSLAAALIVVPKLTGSIPLTVLTSSMEPTMPPGSVVIVRPTDAGDLRVGDVITYQLRSGEPEVVTHRIISLVSSTDGSTKFVTQGDNNGAADPTPVDDVQIRGKVWYDVPLVGHVSSAITAARRSMIVNVLAGGLLLYACYLIGTGLLERRRRTA